MVNSDDPVVVRRARIARWVGLAKRIGYGLLLLAVVLLLGAGDDSAARFKKLGHRMMCPCSCSQMLLECNHVGCQYSERMRADLDTDAREPRSFTGWAATYGSQCGYYPYPSCY